MNSITITVTTYFYFYPGLDVEPNLDLPTPSFDPLEDTTLVIVILSLVIDNVVETQFVDTLGRRDDA